jgi:DNA gyrase subunit A
MVRTAVRDIREAGRNTMGVKLIELETGDRLQAIAPVISEERDDEVAESATPELPEPGTPPPPIAPNS